MDQTPHPREGGCRCGRVRFRLTVPVMLTSACHCTGCQRMTASAFSLTTSVPSDGLALLQGETAIGGLHRADVRHHHCDHCKSWLYSHAHPDPGFINVRTTMLDDPAGLDPFVETYAAEKLAWATTPAPHSFATVPADDGWGPLLEAYPAWAAGRG